MADSTITLQEAASLIRQGVQPKDVGDMPYIGLEHIEEGTLRLLGIGNAKDVMSTKFRFSKGDILFGKLRPYFRKVIRAPFDGVCSTDIWVVRSKSRIDQGYLYYWMASYNFVNFATQGSEGTKMPRAKWEHVGRFEQPHLPETEQRAIAHILGSLDDKIELNRKMNETLEAMARAIFKSWFVDFDPVVWNVVKAGKPVPARFAETAARYKADLSAVASAKAEGRDTGLPKEIADLFPDNFEDSELGEIPTGWRVGTIGQVADVTDCLHSKKPERKDSGRPLLQLWNIRDDGLIDMTNTYHISEKDYQKWISRIEASVGDCVITNVGRVGAVSQIPEGSKAALGRNMTAIRCKFDFNYPIFLIELLLSNFMRKEIAAKTDDGTILSALNVRNIPKLRMVIPQKVILNKFEFINRPIRRKMERNHKQSRTLVAIRDTLLPKLISGELHVPNVERLLIGVET